MGFLLFSLKHINAYKEKRVLFVMVTKADVDEVKDAVSGDMEITEEESKKATKKKATKKKAAKKKATKKKAAKKKAATKKKTT